MTVQLSICRLAAVGLAFFALMPQPAIAGSKETETLEAASDVLDAFVAIPLRGIPPALLRGAQGIAIIPNVIKASFVIGGRHGRGVLLARDANGIWSKPTFITITGGGVGWQAGIQSTDLILVFKTKNSVDKMFRGKGKVTLGADVGVAAGPLGRQAEADTDAGLNAEILSYSRSRGLFLGLSLEGAALLADPRATDAYYHTPPVAGAVPMPPSDEKLRVKLTALTAPPVPAPLVPAPSSPPPPLAPPVAIPVPPPPR
jgi:lipid-binding SYLF domain-containing protein